MMLKSILCAGISGALSFSVVSAADKVAVLPSGPQADGNFKKVVLEADKDTNGDGEIDDFLEDPMELAVAKDGRVFYILRNGTVRVIDPKTRQSSEVGKVKVFTGLEDGLLGITLDPKFEENSWIYLYYATPETVKNENGKKAGENRVARFTLNDGKLDVASEKVLVKVNTQREQCCHSGGSLNFDKDGNLYVSTGDNTNPFESDGYAPIDERPGRSPWDAQKSAANPNDLRGKVLRVKPEADGTVTIPKGNLFPVGTPDTRPEIFVMGCRNPFRIGFDPKNGILYYGDVGPDAGSANPSRGPAGFDEINQVKQAGFFGWPLFIADNKPYTDFNFEGRVSASPFDPSRPVNDSPNNTGIKELPPAQPAFIYYPHSPSTRFPTVNAGGGRTAMAGPVYYFDASVQADYKLPADYNHTLFIYEWSRNWIIAVHLDENEKIQKMERVWSNMTFKRPMDMELGPDGALYIIEYGTNWSQNKDSQIVRIEHSLQHAAHQ
jgi:cytochrome c